MLWSIWSFVFQFCEMKRGSRVSRQFLHINRVCLNATHLPLQISQECPTENSLSEKTIILLVAWLFHWISPAYEKRHLKSRIDYYALSTLRGGIWKQRFDSETTITGHLGFVLEENAVKKITWLSWVRAVGLAVQIKLCFRNPWVLICTTTSSGGLEITQNSNCMYRNGFFITFVLNVCFFSYNFYVTRISTSCFS